MYQSVKLQRGKGCRCSIPSASMLIRSILELKAYPCVSVLRSQKPKILSTREHSMASFQSNQFICVSALCQICYAFCPALHLQCLHGIMHLPHQQHVHKKHPIALPKAYTLTESGVGKKQLKKKSHVDSPRPKAACFVRANAVLRGGAAMSPDFFHLPAALFLHQRTHLRSLLQLLQLSQVRGKKKKPTLTCGCYM